MRILFVEDKEDLAFIGQCKLARRDPDLAKEIVRASSYSEAVAALEKDAFDLIILDFDFPGRVDERGVALDMNGGVEVYRYVQENDIRGADGAKSLVFFWSSREDFEIAEALEREGFTLPRGRIFTKFHPLLEVIHAFRDEKGGTGNEAERPCEKGLDGRGRVWGVADNLKDGP